MFYTTLASWDTCSVLHGQPGTLLVVLCNSGKLGHWLFCATRASWETCSVQHGQAGALAVLYNTGKLEHLLFCTTRASWDTCCSVQHGQAGTLVVRYNTGKLEHSLFCTTRASWDPCCSVQHGQSGPLVIVPCDTVTLRTGYRLSPVCKVKSNNSCRLATGKSELPKIPLISHKRKVMKTSDGGMLCEKINVNSATGAMQLKFHWVMHYRYCDHE